MADDCHLGKIEIGLSPYVSNVLADRPEIWHANKVWPTSAVQPLKFRKFKNPKWQRPSSWKTEKSKNRHISLTDCHQFLIILMKNCVTLWLTVAKLWCFKLCVFFLRHLELYILCKIKLNLIPSNFSHQFERSNLKQVVTVVWRKGCIAATHGRFNRIRQVAPMCTPSNTWFLGPTRVHNPNDISIGSAVFAGSRSPQTNWQTTLLGR